MSSEQRFVWIFIVARSDHRCNWTHRAHTPISLFRIYPPEACLLNPASVLGFPRNRPWAPENRGRQSSVGRPGSLILEPNQLELSLWSFAVISSIWIAPKTFHLLRWDELRSSSCCTGFQYVLNIGFPWKQIFRHFILFRTFIIVIRVCQKRDSNPCFQSPGGYHQPFANHHRKDITTSTPQPVHLERRITKRNTLRYRESNPGLFNVSGAPIGTPYGANYYM